MVILEIIPTAFSNGEIIQLCALKIEGITLIDRLDLRIVSDKIPFLELENLINYDSEKFTYLSSTGEMINAFYSFLGSDQLLIFNNKYTLNYIKYDNYLFVDELLGVENNDNIVSLIVSKYELLPTNYIVDLIYEAIIKKSNFDN